MESTVDHIKNFNLDDTGKIDLTNIYDRLDPRQYYSTLGELDYLIPEAAKPVFQTVIDAYRKTRDQEKVRIIDVGCSYGVNAALLKCDLEMDQLYGLYGSRSSLNTSHDNLLKRDKSFLEASVKDPNLEVVGLDASRNAITYAVAANLLDDGIAENLESGPPSPEAAAVLDEADLVISTGCIGYIGENTLKRIVEVNAPRRPWMVHFVLRMFPFDEVETALGELGYLTDKVESRVFPQRRFASQEEQDQVLKRLAELGIDSDGLESDDWYYAEAYVSRPADELSSLSVTRAGLADGRGDALNFGRPKEQGLRAGRATECASHRSHPRAPS